MRALSGVRVRAGISVVVSVATLIGVLTVAVVGVRAQAQTLGDCNSYTSEGKWDLAAESCFRVLQTIQSVRQSQTGEYCDNNCAHTLDEIPDPLDSVQMTAAYARAAENEGIAEMHRGHYAFAQFWLKQSNFNAKVLATMRTRSALMQQYVPVGREIESETDSLLAKVKPHVPSPPKQKPIRATPAPRCADPNKEASIASAVATNYPDSARDLGLGPVTVLVQVDLEPSGALSSAHIYKSSGNGDIDAEALRSARASTYWPKVQNCKAVRGSFLFRAEFDPD